ncbi:hypothetical protein WICMUC_001033 [Wickerhamomyces mucosus]|uniref:Sulfite efflux pump SSU1 n=1 Tax=Wickerhamomyces mucosus TaxID=1378264 RepID=A0A9P8TH61_9ASCO|nr:hypothetical protein WICMUC_001033 [Wickerhamomyces mucosus]
MFHIKDIPLFKDFQIKWFICTMGTGIMSSILYSFPYHAQWLEKLGILMFSLCSLLLLFMLISFIIHLTITNDRESIFYDLDKNVYLGTLVMGITSWSSMFFTVTGTSSIIFVYVLWWLNVTLALSSGFVVVLCIFKRSVVKSSEITPVLLLPVVTLMVTSSFGFKIIQSLPRNLQLTSLIINFLLWSLALMLSFILTVFYFYRLLIHKLPGKDVIFTSFIPIGFLGQGSYSIQLFGENYQSYLLNKDLVTNQDLIEGLIFRNLGILVGLFLQSFGFYLTIISIVSVFSQYPHKFHFGWWAVTFPMGTMSLGTLQTFELTGWEYSRIISVIYAAILFIAVLICLTMPTFQIISNWIKTKLTKKVHK